MKYDCIEPHSAKYHKQIYRVSSTAIKGINCPVSTRDLHSITLNSITQTYIKMNSITHIYREYHPAEYYTQLNR